MAAGARLSANDEVNETLHRAIEANPQGRSAEVVGPLRRATMIEPENPVTHLIYGQALMPLGRHEEALEAFGRAAVLRPETPQVHEFRAMALFNLGRFEDSLRPLGRLLEIDPEYPRAQYHMGLALAKLGRHAEAIAAYDRAEEHARAARGRPAAPGPEHPTDGEIAFERSASEVALGRAGGAGRGPPRRSLPPRWSPP